MLIMPAIDLKDGQCVRLMQGRFDDVTPYGDPIEQVRAFARAGAQWAHVVDLDGARSGRPVQYELIGRLARETEFNIQCGGGVRAGTDVEALIKHGVARVVVGSAAVWQPRAVRSWIAALGRDRICLALDVKRVGALWEVVVNGWREGTGVSLDGALDLYAGERAVHVLVTDVSRDGAMRGPNVALMQRLTKQYPGIAFQASGGVGRLTDLTQLRRAGAAATIVGRALYEERFTLEAALGL